MHITDLNSGLQYATFVNTLPTMKKKTTLDVCPCLWQDGVLFADCCGRYIAGTALAPTAEALMRSRYSAFVKEASDYLLQTWHPSTRPAAMDFEPTQWLGLKVISARDIDDSHAEVSFSARYKINGRAHKMQENSRFVREQGAWLYVDGDVDTN